MDCLKTKNIYTLYFQSICSRCRKLCFWVIATLCMSLSHMSGQAFEGKAILGFTASQIDGDNLAGFNKLGLTGGLGVERFISKKGYVGMEMLYCQRGSQAELSFGSGDFVSSTNLNYLEIPVFAGYKDWWMAEDGYYKVGVHGGFSYGYLFSSSSNNTFVEGDIENFRTSSLSWLLGVNYALSKSWNAVARYTRDLSLLFDGSNNPGVDGLKSYFWAVRMEYKF